jgi:hypothetical protein
MAMGFFIFLSRIFLSARSGVAERVAEAQGPRRQPAIIDSPVETQCLWRCAAEFAPRPVQNW